MTIFIVHARINPEVLSRIVLLFHRRRVQIDSLRAEFDREADVLRLEVEIEDEGRADLIEANLYKVWDVVLVEKKSVCGDRVFQVTKGGQRER